MLIKNQSSLCFILCTLFFISCTESPLNSNELRFKEWVDKQPIQTLNLKNKITIDYDISSDSLMLKKIFSTKPIVVSNWLDQEEVILVKHVFDREKIDLTDKLVSFRFVEHYYPAMVDRLDYEIEQQFEEIHLYKDSLLLSTYMTINGWLDTLD